MRARDSIVAALFIAVPFASLVACGNKSSTDQSTPNAATNTAMQTPPPNPAQPTTPTPQQQQPQQQVGPCVACNTQEDFDNAQKNHKACCPGHSCTADSECGRGGRVCCRIPTGQICIDSNRCASTDRVGITGQKCAKSKDCSALEVCCATSHTCTGQAKCAALACNTDIDCHVKADMNNFKCTGGKCVAP